MTSQILLTLRTSDGCVGQRFVTGRSSMAWDIDPNGETVQAIFTLIDDKALRVLEVAEIDGDQWRALEGDDGCDDWELDMRSAVHDNGSLADFLMCRKHELSDGQWTEPA